MNRMTIDDFVLQMKRGLNLDDEYQLHLGISWGHHLGPIHVHAQWTRQGNSYHANSHGESVEHALGSLYEYIHGRWIKWM